MKHKITGYLVVRYPENHCFHNSNSQTTLAQRSYSGVQRCAWEEIIEDYYEKRLPDNLATIFSRIMRIEYPHDILLTQSLPEAVALLKYSNRQNQWNEIITVYSEVFSPHRGEVEIDSAYHTILGYDYMHPSSQSITFEGIHSWPKGFRKWQKRLNSFGLFNSPKYLEEYHEKFLEVSETRFLENYGTPKPFCFACRIGRIDIQGLEHDE